MLKGKVQLNSQEEAGEKKEDPFQCDVSCCMGWLARAVWKGTGRKAVRPLVAPRSWRVTGRAGMAGTICGKPGSGTGCSAEYTHMLWYSGAGVQMGGQVGRSWDIGLTGRGLAIRARPPFSLFTLVVHEPGTRALSCPDVGPSLKSSHRLSRLLSTKPETGWRFPPIAPRFSRVGGAF